MANFHFRTIRQYCSLLGIIFTVSYVVSLFTEISTKTDDSVTTIYICIIFNLSAVNCQSGSNGRKCEKMDFRGATPTAAAAGPANVTNPNFKSYTVPLQTTLLACEPSEKKQGVPLQGQARVPQPLPTIRQAPSRVCGGGMGPMGIGHRLTLTALKRCRGGR